MPITVDRFLHAQGFSGHPFATTNAERETELLPSFFVPGEWFDWLVGDPTQPQSLILFAQQGYGKTSYRVELARELSQRREHTALVVTIDDFAPLIRNGRDAISLDSHIRLIRRLTLEALDKQIERSSVRRAFIEQDPALLAQLFGLLQLFAPRRTIGRSPPPDADTYARAVTEEAFGPREWLRELAGLAHAVGFSSIYCLLDGLDELHELRTSPGDMARLLGPLLDAPGLLDECSFAFRFFIPHDVADEMKRQQIGRLDRIPHRVLSWSDEQLLDMLTRRLASFSRDSGSGSNSRVSSLRLLCDTPIDADQLLVRAAVSSPRQLIDLGRRLFEQHCLIATSPHARITSETLSLVLSLPTLDRVSSISPNSVQAPLASSVGRPATDPPTTNPALVDPSLDSTPPQIPPLYLDSWGDIWVGDQRMDKPIGGMMRRCLEYLWENRIRRVSYDELIEVLYGKDLHERGDPQGSMEKLIKRLRAILEPETNSSHTYIKTQPGTGYVLQNYRDTP